jgi:hypothetical protein
MDCSCIFPEPRFGGKDYLSAIGPDTEIKLVKQRNVQVG